MRNAKLKKNVLVKGDSRGDIDMTIKKLIVTLIIVFCLFPVASYALDGEIYVGKFRNPTDFRAYPDGGQTKFIALIELGHRIKFARPYIELETLMEDVADAVDNAPAGRIIRDSE